jgi:type I restriction enzyme S subunit
MSLSFKFIPLTFLNDENEIKKQIRNTIILKYFFERNSETVRLEDLITGTQYGYNASALVQGRNKFLRISDITDGKVNWKTVPYCNCTDEKTYLLFPNDILIARTGGTTGKSFLISEPPALSIYAGYLIRIRANEKTNPDYLNLFLNSYVYWSQIVSLNEDNFRPSVNAEKLKKLILPKCDQNSQNDAVKISNGELINGYDDLYKLIEETLIKYDKLKEIQLERKSQYELQKKLKQTIIQEAIEGKLTEKWCEENPTIEVASKLLERIKKEKDQLVRDKKIKKEKLLSPISEEEIPFELPENWVWCRLGEICLIKGGKRVSNGYKLLKSPTKHIYIRVTDMKNGTIYEDDIHYIDSNMYEQIKNYTISKDDLYITIAGTIGQIGIIPDKFDNVNLTENAAKIVFNNSLINKLWLKAFLSSTFAQLQFSEKTTTKTSQPKLALTRISTGELQYNVKSYL